MTIPDSEQFLSDADAMDRLARFLARPGQWNGGDVCELAAGLVVATGRPNPGTPPAGDADGDCDDAPPPYVEALAQRRSAQPSVGDPNARDVLQEVNLNRAEGLPYVVFSNPHGEGLWLVEGTPQDLLALFSAVVGGLSNG